MIPHEIHLRLKAFAATISEKASVSIVISDNGSSIGMINPDGLVGREKTIHVKWPNEATWGEAVTAIEETWVEYASRSKLETVKSMALCIIENSDPSGRCSDAILRMKFGALTIKRLGIEAVEAANEMASRGPFSIAVSDSNASTALSTHREGM